MAGATELRRAAIVTGGGRGIGAATAQALASRGFAVLVVDIDVDALERCVRAIEEAGGTAAGVTADVSQDGDVAAYVAACEERFGGVDAFFSNAAVEGAIAPVTEYPVDVFDRVFAINVRGVFLGLKHVIPAMRRRGGGSIVNTASQAGVRGVPGLTGYSASKHAVVGLSQSAALEVAAEGIRVNCVCPGPTDTRMMRDIEQVVRAGGGDPSSFTDRIPVGRYGRSEEIAAYVAWVLADAPPFLTGAVLTIDGAMTAP
jgi:NAD(P)-dependent dehydrogenase (short-subunit alcohol dehydrogenase family)